MFDVRRSVFGFFPHAHTRAPAHDRSAGILSLVKWRFEIFAVVIETRIEHENEHEKGRRERLD